MAAFATPKSGSLTSQAIRRLIVDDTTVSFDPLDPNLDFCQQIGESFPPQVILHSEPSGVSPIVLAPLLNSPHAELNVFSTLTN